MQLITMTMPMGDKGKNKNRNRHASSSGAGTTSNQNRSDQHSHSDNLAQDNGNRPPDTTSVETHSQIPVSQEHLHTSLFVLTDESLGGGRTSSLHQHMPSAPASVSSLLPIFSLPDVLSYRDNVTPVEHSQVPGHEMHCEMVEDESDNASEKLLLGTGPVQDEMSCGSSQHISSGESHSDGSFTINQDKIMGQEAATEEMPCSGFSCVDTKHEGVDENMNPTCVHQLNLASQQQCFDDGHFHTLDTGEASSVELSSEPRQKQNMEEGSRDNSAEPSVITFVDVAGISSQTMEPLIWVSDTVEPNSPQQQLSSEKDSDSDMSNSLSYRNDILELNLPTTNSSFLLQHIGSFQNDSVLEPPLWTSLALRDNVHIVNFPPIVQPVAQNLSSVDGISLHSHSQTSNDMTRAGTVPEQFTQHYSLSRPESVNDRDVPEHYVFQNCSENDLGFASGACVNDVCVSVNKDSDVRILNNSPLALGDLDEFLGSMLPSVADDRDILLGQLADEEVAMIRSYNDDEGEAEEEELAIIDFSDTDVIEARRTSNPIANVLEYGGDED